MDNAHLRTDIQFNPFDYRFHASPKLAYKSLRDQSPVHYNEDLNLWTLSRYRDVYDGLTNDSVYSFCHSDTYEKFHPELSEDLVGFFCHDAPEHNALRQLTGRPFTPTKADEMSSLIRGFSDYYCKKAICTRGTSRIDFMTDIAGPMTMGVIGNLLHIPESDRESIRHWIDLTVARDDGSPSVQPEALAASETLLQYLYEHWSYCERNLENCTGIIKTIIEKVNEGALPKKQGISFLWGLCYAGQESTAKLLGNCFYQAWNNNLQRLMHEYPNLISKLVDETMRFDSPAQIVYRTLMSDVQLYGVKIPAGARVALILGSANLDEREWETKYH